MARRQKTLPTARIMPGIKGVDFHRDPKPRYVAQPRVFVTLNPETDEMAIELTENGSRQKIKVTDLDTIYRVLKWRKDLFLMGEVMRIGEGADPTEAQIKHWENHMRRTTKTKLESNCPFCIAEARNGDDLEKKVRKYDTRGNLIQVVNSAAEIGFVKKKKPVEEGNP